MTALDVISVFYVHGWIPFELNIIVSVMTAMKDEY